MFFLKCLFFIFKKFEKKSLKKEKFWEKDFGKKNFEKKFGNKNLETKFFLKNLKKNLKKILEKKNFEKKNFEKKYLKREIV